VELLYIDDLIEGMFNLLEGREKRRLYERGIPILIEA
jgi:hypothetical protein